jgi:hypothetical protein
LNALEGKFKKPHPLQTRKDCGAQHPAQNIANAVMAGLVFLRFNRG